jgi:hypothetical protein
MFCFGVIHLYNLIIVNQKGLQGIALVGLGLFMGLRLVIYEKQRFNRLI